MAPYKVRGLPRTPSNSQRVSEHWTGFTRTVNDITLALSENKLDGDESRGEYTQKVYTTQIHYKLRLLLPTKQISNPITVWLEKGEMMTFDNNNKMMQNDNYYKNEQ